MDLYGTHIALLWIYTTLSFISLLGYLFYLHNKIKFQQKYKIEHNNNRNEMFNDNEKRL